MHPLAGGLVLTQPSLNYRELGLKEFVAAIGKLLGRSVEEEPDGWLQVELWDATAMDKLPTKEDLDKLETSRPILVISLDGHIALANSRALEIGGVGASTPDPPGGEIRRGPGREPTGILLDSAINLVFDQIPERTTEQNARAFAAALRVMAKQGITSFLEVSAGENELAALALLSDQGELTARPSVAITGGSKLAEDPAALLAHVEELRSDLRPSGHRDPHREAVLRRGDRVSDPNRGPAQAVSDQQGHEEGAEVGARQEQGPDLLPAPGRQRGDRRARRRRLAGPRARDRRPRRALGARRLRARARRQRRERQSAHDLPTWS